MRAQYNLKFFGQLAAVSLGTLLDCLVRRCPELTHRATRHCAIQLASGVEKMADGGSVVLTSGALSRRPGKGSSALGSCNAALEAIVKGLANDLGPRVRVNCVSPGLTNTEMWAGLPAEKREGMLVGFGSKLPLKRAGESEDVGDAIAMLLCASYTTGMVFDCDGGATIRSE